jgi:phage major head subunit gpT-like protein
MGTEVLGKLGTKGALANFHERLSTIESVWDKHSLRVPSTTQTETYVMPGFTPTPRQFLDSRQIQNMNDFTFDIANNEYELTMVIPRKSMEDDQTGLIRARMQELAEVWGTYKDSLFAALLEAGNVSGNNDVFGNTFHGDSHTIGTSGVCDNNRTGDHTVTTATVAEALTIISNIRIAYYSFRDDTGRPFSPQALTNLRVIVPPGHERPFYEAMNQTVTGGDTNVWGSQYLQGIDVLPYLTGTDELFFSLLGSSSRKPFIYQERTPLEVIILDGANDVADNNGIKVLCRQRFVLTYGDPRMSILYTIT